MSRNTSQSGNASQNDGAACANSPYSPIVLDRVTLRYERGVTALSDVSLTVAPGERICVLGANGSGKSTLASVIAGLLAPDEGTVRLVGEPVCTAGTVDFAAYGRARQRLGLVFQNPDDQIVTTVVEDDVAFGPENLGVPSDTIADRVERELRRVALTSLAKADPTRLSGGQKQRVAIAGALAMEPEVLVLDEPGALLDVRGRRGIMHVMAKLQAAGTTVVHITHFMEEALAADRAIVMEAGHVVLDGTPEQVFSVGEKIARLGLEMPFSARLVCALRDRGVDVGWTIDAGVLREELRALLAHRGQRRKPMPAPTGEAGALGGSRPAKPVGTKAPGNGTKAAGAIANDGDNGTAAIELEGVGYSYGSSGGARAIDGVSLSVGAGDSVAIVGQTGSGKSTLLRIICALETPDCGRVRIHGIDTADRRERQRIHGRIGYVMQHPERQLFAETVLEDVAYGPRNLGLSGDALDECCRHALSMVGMLAHAEASPFELSGGQQRLVAIAGVLAMEPQTLVLDEPTAGLDPHGRAELRRILADIHARGITVVQVTHSMEDAARCERVIVLNQSRVMLDGTPRQVFAANNAELLRASGLGLPRALAWSRELAAPDAIGESLTLDALADSIARAVGATIELREVR